jgi:hypothetical protein
MGGNENDGYYCTICGGIPPDKITTKRVLIDGRETGIDYLDWIFEEVRKLAANNDNAVTEEILNRVKLFNYVPTKKTAEYGTGLLAAYKKFRAKKQCFSQSTAVISFFPRPTCTHRLNPDQRVFGRPQDNRY